MGIRETDWRIRWKIKGGLQHLVCHVDYRDRGMIERPKGCQWN